MNASNTSSRGSITREITISRSAVSAGDIFGGGEWYAVAGGVLEIIGIVTAAALRAGDDAWAARG
ncbi:hypothetical protein [Sanguibacter gelidistatuariae]|uniref:hypothetical protein n=1 Tax=Sanguibacter gelidistatuariae TaxID=1814289 RepID=UPI001C31C3C9|nr:hypothetical protein [Sanguibacter gelidistatuariae]